MHEQTEARSLHPLDKARMRAPSLTVVISSCPWPGRGYQARLAINDRAGRCLTRRVVRVASLDRRLASLEAVWWALRWIRERCAWSPGVDLILQDADAWAILTQEVPARGEAGRWYLLIGSLSNSLGPPGRIRFRLGMPPDDLPTFRSQGSLDLFSAATRGGRPNHAPVGITTTETP